MKAKIFIMAAVAFLSIGSVFAINSYTIERKEDIIRSSLPFVLKVHNENIAVFQGDEVIEVFYDVIYDSLPEYDRNALKRGLRFDSMSEVYSAVEDFDG